MRLILAIGGLGPASLLLPFSFYLAPSLTSSSPRPRPAGCADIANHVNAHHRVMAHWDRVLPGRVLHLHYAHMVQNQVGGCSRAGLVLPALLALRASCSLYRMYCLRAVATTVESGIHGPSQLCT